MNAEARMSAAARVTPFAIAVLFLSTMAYVAATVYGMLPPWSTEHGLSWGIAGFVWSLQLTMSVMLLAWVRRAWCPSVR